MSPRGAGIRRAERGVVLAGATLFLLILTVSATVFIERATVDGLITRNRDDAARCEALARGGVQLATALLLQDRLDELAADFRADTRQDLWARARDWTLEAPDGGTLVLRIEDAGARLNLNALFQDGEPRDPATEVFLAALLEKVQGEMTGRGLKVQADPQELAQNLIDWVDADDLRLAGGLEDDYYQQQAPRYRAPNRPLLSVDELALVQGFDQALVEALRPYVSVHPLAGGDGVNPNSAPSYVLASLYHGTAGDYRLADEEIVRAVLDIRARGGILCRDEADHPDCTPIREAVPGEIVPPPTWTSEVFHVSAEASYGNVRRTVEAVIDRSDVNEPRLLAWRVP